MTLYDILGLTRDASPDEIRAAYRALAKQYHPDLVRQADRETQHLAEERLKAINEAYTTLSDPVARARYHQIMWTSRDPARRYQKIFPQRPPPNGQATSPKPNPTDHLLVQLSALRADLDYLHHRQQVKRRRFMFGALFSTLIVFFFMWLENTTLSTTQYDLIPWLGSFFFTFLSTEILLAIPIIINASAMRIPRYPGISSPIGFSLSIFAGTTLACTAIIAPRTGGSISQELFIMGGIPVSCALLIHVYLIRRLSRLQDQLFNEERETLKQRIRHLERQLDENQKNR
ncbi:MAG: J domain-containing protein [Anaerolineales bacterium]|nr:J domain-containing protein [Anaerolineales bacterium]